MRGLRRRHGTAIGTGLVRPGLCGSGFFRYTSTNLPALSTNPSALLKERATFTYCKHIRIDVRSPQPRSARRPCLCESAREPDVAAPAGMRSAHIHSAAPFALGNSCLRGTTACLRQRLGVRVRGRAYLRTVFCAARDGRAKPTRDQTRVPSAAGTNRRFRPPSQLSLRGVCAVALFVACGLLVGTGPADRPAYSE